MRHERAPAFGHCARWRCVLGVSSVPDRDQRPCTCIAAGQAGPADAQDLDATIAEQAANEVVLVDKNKIMKPVRAPPTKSTCLPWLGPHSFDDALAPFFLGRTMLSSGSCRRLNVAVWVKGLRVGEDRAPLRVPVVRSGY